MAPLEHSTMPWWSVCSAMLVSQRGGRPVTSTTVAPARSAASRACTVRVEIVPSDLTMVPSRSVATILGTRDRSASEGCCDISRLGNRLEDHSRALRSRVADPRTSLKFTREGLELSSRVDALEGSVETQQLKADVLAKAMPVVPVESGSGDIPQTLVNLRANYLAVDEPDRERRIRIKNELARSMGAEVLRANVNRRILADQRDEVLTLALAAAVIALPQAGDDDLILAAGAGIERLHVRYRIAVAVSELVQSQILKPKLVPGGLFINHISGFTRSETPAVGTAESSPQFHRQR